MVIFPYIFEHAAVQSVRMIKNKKRMEDPMGR